MRKCQDPRIWITNHMALQYGKVNDSTKLEHTLPTKNLDINLENITEDYQQSTYAEEGNSSQVVIEGL